VESETGSGEVLDRCFEHLQIIAAGNIAVQTGTDSLGMAHLAEDTAVRRGDAFDGKERVVMQDGVMKIDVNGTVKGTSTGKDVAVLGDFENAFKWGYAKEIPLEVIEYGNPDNDATLGDLKGHNQVYLRAEAYIGWAILDAARFAIVAAE